MPLRDHFHPPVSDAASWEEVHGQWPAVIVQQLGKVLPERYVAAPRIHLGSQIEVDIAALDRNGAGASSSAQEAGAHHPDEDGGVATAVWAPAAPSMSIETDLGGFDEYEVRVYDAARGRRLVAAIEIVSPANKDRPESRRQFIAKCVALLREGVCIVLVDLITTRGRDLFDELLEWIGQREAATPAAPSSAAERSATYAVTCRWHPRAADRRWLETWNRPLLVGQPLPVLPLWLSETLAVPLDLEVSYEQTCRDLRIA